MFRKNLEKRKVGGSEEAEGPEKRKVGGSEEAENQNRFTASPLYRLTALPLDRLTA